MQRLNITPRDNWQSKVEEDGILWSTTENGPYWNEAMDKPAYYSFTKQEQSELEHAGNVIHKLCLDSLNWMLEEADEETRNTWFDNFCIPVNYRQYILDSWENDEWALYGRFDFIMTKEGPKLLEYNADTPTTLIESAITQWNWFDDNRSKFPENTSQFNEIHEALVRHWGDMKSNNHITDKVHFTAFSQIDDMATVVYMAETAKEAGLEVEVLPIEHVGLVDNNFIDSNGKEIRNCFKLYPWEWMSEDAYGDYIPNATTRWIEPSWKMLLSNKAILALLYKRYPECKYLVPSYLSDKEFKVQVGEKWVTKPLLSREGSNIVIWEGTEQGVVELSSTKGDYDESKIVYQKFIEWVEFDGNYPMLGVWMVGDAVGLGIREDDTVVTQNNSRFIPHVFGE